MTHTSDSQVSLADVQSASCKKKNMLQNIFMDFFPFFVVFFFLPDPPTPLSPNGQFYLQTKTTGQKPQTTYLITALSFTTEKLSLPRLNYRLFLDSEGWRVDSKALN